MKKIFFIPLFLLVSFSTFASENQVILSHGWIKQLPPVVPMRAGYFKIQNNRNQPVEIVSISSPDFSKIEIHKTEQINGVMKMTELDNLTVPAKENLAFEPGGLHLMMFDPAKTAKLDYKSSITIHYRNLSPQTFPMVVKK